jgi:hypothetical protein
LSDLTFVPTIESRSPLCLASHALCSPLLRHPVELTATREEVPEWQGVAMDALVAASGGGVAVAACGELCTSVASAGTHGLGPHPLVRRATVVGALSVFNALLSARIHIPI